MAELYDSGELPGPPRHREASKLPEHLPGFGEMSDYEKACALAIHVGADLASLGRALGLEGMAAALTDRYGDAAATWYRDLAARVPRALLDAVSAVAVPDLATELLYVCRRPA
jgi:hypothetical protein